jgi:hypothetical protein
VLIWHRMTLRTFLYVEVTFRVAFVAKRKHFAVDSCEPSPFKKRLYAFPLLCLLLIT